jgi:hypothetical protein
MKFTKKKATAPLCREGKKVCGLLQRVWASDYCVKYCVFLPNGERTKRCVDDGTGIVDRPTERNYGRKDR